MNKKKGFIKITLFVLMITLAGCHNIVPPSSVLESTSSPVNSTPDATSSSSDSVNANSQENDSSVTDNTIELPWSPSDQPDPTLEENQRGSFIVWNHKEYKAFAYEEHRIHDIILLNEETDVSAVAMIELPISCSIGDYNRIEYDGGFANGTLTIGTIIGYYELGNDESPLDNNLFNEMFAFNPKPSNTEESSEICVGNYINSERWSRFIGEIRGDNTAVYYTILLGNGYITVLSLNVSQEASVEDMLLYDKIANSIILL